MLTMDPNALKGMREAGKRLAEVSEILKENIVPGVTGRELDELAEREIRKRNSVPAFKGYVVFQRQYVFLLMRLLYTAYQVINHYCQVTLSL